MSVRRLDSIQPKSFEFTPANQKWAKEQIAKYPNGRQASAVIPLLWRAQEQNGGWLPEPALRAVADMLDMAYIRVYEVATFYTMFNLSPIGKYYVQLCGTTPCWLRGAEGLKEVCRRVIGEQSRVTPDGTFSWLEVECLGACTNAPMVQINKDYYEDLTPEILEKILNDLRDGKDVKAGPQTGRQFSAPEGGPTTLLYQANGKASGHTDMPGKDMSGKPASGRKNETTRRTKGTPADNGSVDVKVTPEKSADARTLEEEKEGRPALDYPKAKARDKSGYDKPPVGADAKSWRTPDDENRSASARKKSRLKGK